MIQIYKNKNIFKTRFISNYILYIIFCLIIYTDKYKYIDENLSMSLNSILKKKIKY